MKLLVTGGAGFIGSHVIRRWLANHPHDHVVNLDRLTYAGSADRLKELAGSNRYQFAPGDVCEPAVVERTIQGCRVVIHLAAETHVDRSITNATAFLRTNVEGTHVVLGAARAAGVERLVHVSTDEVYGPVLKGAVDERAPLAPRSPYAASKAAGDLLVQAFRATYGLPVIIVRPTNIFGPSQLVEKFIPLCITNALDKHRIPLYGDGQQRRNWLFIDDLCEALELITERGAVGEIYNVASGHEQPNRETVTMILGLLGQPTHLIEPVADRPGHDRRYAMDDGKLRALGWAPRVPFAQGLAQTVVWYREHVEWWRPLAQRLREDPYHWLHRPVGTSAHPAAGSIG